MADQRYVDAARAAAARYGVPANVLMAQIQAESGWNPHAHSGAGAVGIAQFMPGTARAMGVNPSDPMSAIDGMARLDARNLKAFGGDMRLALAAYNAGGGAARKALTGYPETRAYVAKIMGSAGAGQDGADAQGGPAPAMPHEGEHTDAKVGAIEGAFAGRANANMRDLLRAAVGGDAYTQAGQALAASRSSQGGSDVASPSAATGPAVHASGNVRGIEDLFAHVTGAPGTKPTVGQTTGGQHAVGSNHYSGHAVDFGDASYSRATLLRMAAYAKAHPQQFREFYYNPAGFTIKNGQLHMGATMAGHDDHEHIAI